MFFNKKINSDIFLLVLLIVRLRLDIGFNDRNVNVPESREVFLGSSSAYTQISFHCPYSSILYSHPKSLEFNEQDEATILFNRLNYFNSVREGRSNLLAYHASSSNVQNAAAGSSNTGIPGNDNTVVDSSLVAISSVNLETDQPSCGLENVNSSVSQELSPDDLKLIEILWKQDIDLGISREAYDLCLDVDKQKDTVQDVNVCEDKSSEEISNSLISGLDFTVDLETGEFVLDELPVLSEEDNSGVQLLENKTSANLNQNYFSPFNDSGQFPDLSDIFPAEEFPDLLTESFTDSDYLLSQTGDIDKEFDSFIENEMKNEVADSHYVDVPSSSEYCWSDSSFLSNLGIENPDPNLFDSLFHNIESIYEDSNIILPASSNNIHFNLDGDSANILLDSPLNTPMIDESFQAIPTSFELLSVNPLAELIASHNDSDPIPVSSSSNALYNSNQPDLFYNKTCSDPQNELAIHNIYTDDALQFVSISSEPNLKIIKEEYVDTSNIYTDDALQFVSMSSEPNLKIIKEEYVDTSSNSTSGIVHSDSDCFNLMSSCSESSSNEENTAHLYSAEQLEDRFLFRNEDAECYSKLSPKRSKYLKKTATRNSDCIESCFEGYNDSDQQYFSVRSKYLDTYKCSANNEVLSSRKFDYSNTRLSDTACRSILQHDHSYHLPLYMDTYENKFYVKDKSKSFSYESSNKDERRAEELKLPISIDDIINLGIDEYNEMLSKYELTDEQQNLIRDIRRRGKNKVAAQNCRKRKMDQINSLQEDLDALSLKKIQLKAKHDTLLQKKKHIDNKCARLNEIIHQFTNCNFPILPQTESLSVEYNNHIPVPASNILTSDDDFDLR